MRSRQNQEAAAAADHSVGLIFLNPSAHLPLARARIRLGEISRAVDALKLATAQTPDYTRAWSLLALLYRKFLNDPARAMECRQRAREAAKRVKAIRNNDCWSEDQNELQESATPTPESSRDASLAEALFSGSLDAPIDAPPDVSIDLQQTAVIVSGLPRSGTSMMMQTLEAGGLPVLSDKQRLPDTSYRVILMQRALDEVLASQQAMLRQEQKKGAALSDKELAAVYRRQMQQGKNSSLTKEVLFSSSTIITPDAIP